MRSVLYLGAVAAALVAGVSPCAAADSQPSEPSIPDVVDACVDARLNEAWVKAAPRADDATLLRRLTLDLAGRIPTAAEVRAYLASSEPDKRVTVVDRLMASPAFVRHQANEFDAMMMAGTRGSLREYLARAFQDDRRWDQIFRELVLADESSKDRAGAAEFVKQRIRDVDRLTSDVSTTFFGVNVSCAKCHDHPRVADWKQDHYYGMKSFFARTYQAGSFLGENDYGTVKFQTTGGEEKRARFMFLTGRVVDVPETAEPSRDEQRERKKRQAEAMKNRQPPPPPKFSVRAQLVDVALQPGEREFFSRAIVNRLWYRFLGTGLIMPLDQMHSENPPSHPELLACLAADLVDHGYDLRRLIRGLVLSEAYARSSQVDDGDRDATDPRLFAVAAVRPLSPLQLAGSMWVAATDPQVLAAAAADARLASLDGKARDLAGALARPGEDYQIGVAEALLFSNSDRTRELLAEGDDRLVGRMLTAQDRDERVAMAVRNVLCREPDADERALLGAYLDERTDRPVEACRQLVWALLNSAEFRFNH